MLEGGELLLATPHLGFQELADIGGHAEVGLGGLYAQPIRHVLPQGQSDVLHDAMPVIRLALKITR